MKALITIIMILFIAISIPAQMKTIKIGGGDAFDIPEVGALVVKDKDNLKFDFVSPAENRPKNYKDVDLQQGDFLIMLNGKKVSSIKDCRSIYEDLKTGDDFKMGIKRGDRMFITSFKKADPKDLPKRKIVIMNDEHNGDMLLFTGMGVLVTKKDNKAVIKSLLRNDVDAVKKANLKEGDEVISLNKKDIKSFDQLKKDFEAIKTGAWVDVRFSGGKMLSFTKEEDKGMIIKREKK